MVVVEEMLVLRDGGEGEEIVDDEFRRRYRKWNFFTLEGYFELALPFPFTCVAALLRSPAQPRPLLSSNATYNLNVPSSRFNRVFVSFRCYPIHTVPDTPQH